MLTYCNLTNRVPKYMCIDSMHFLPVNIYFKNKNFRFISLLLNMVCCLYCVCSICILNILHGWLLLHLTWLLLSQGELRISVLPTHLTYDAPWPVRKVPLRCTPHFVAYHFENKVRDMYEYLIPIILRFHGHNLRFFTVNQFTLHMILYIFFNGSLFTWIQYVTNLRILHLHIFQILA